MLRTSLPYLGRSFDPQLRSLPFGESFFYLRDGEVQLVWPPWFALLTWPFEHLFGPTGLRILPALSAFACGIFSGLISAALIGARTRTPSMLVGVLASPVIVYGMLVWEHALAAALATCAVWLWLPPPRAAWRSALAGALLALACAMRAELWLLCAALLMAALITGREERRAGFALGLALGCASVPFVLWTLWHSEHALPANAARNFTHASLDYVRKNGANVLPHFGWGAGDVWAWLGVGSTVLLLLAAAAVGRKPSAAVSGVRAWLFTASLVAYGASAVVLIGLRLWEPSDDLHGLLESAPWLVLALAAAPGATATGPQRLLHRSVCVYVLLYLLSITLFSWAGPTGGREWGTRFILPVFPLAAPLLIAGLKRSGELRQWLARTYQATALLCVVLALSLHVKGLRVVHRAEWTQAVLAHQLLVMPEGTLFVGLQWWIPTLLAAQFERRAMFWVKEPLEWNEIVGRAACAGQGDVWLAGMMLPDAASLRSMTVPELELQQISENKVAGLELRSLSVRPLTQDVCGYLATHEVPYPPKH